MHNITQVKAVPIVRRNIHELAGCVLTKGIRERYPELAQVTTEYLPAYIFSASTGGQLQSPNFRHSKPAGRFESRDPKYNHRDLKTPRHITTAWQRLSIMGASAEKFAYRLPDTIDCQNQCSHRPVTNARRRYPTPW